VSGAVDPAHTGLSTGVAHQVASPGHTQTSQPGRSSRSCLRRSARASSSLASCESVHQFSPDMLSSLAVQPITRQYSTAIPPSDSWAGLAYAGKVVDSRGPEPAYLQLAQLLRERIQAGDWESGPLPSIAQLQGEYDIGKDTVIRAIKILESDGLVFTVARRGTYVKR
jgi:GntR family transcriptional regulator